jgi:hypothetical protein
MGSIDGEAANYEQVQPPKKDEEDIARRFPLRQTLALLALVGVADICLYDTFGGLGVACLFAITTGVLTLLAPDRCMRPHRAALAAIGLSCAMAIWNHSWLVSFVGWTAIVGYAIKLHNPTWRVTELLVAFSALLGAAPARLFVHLTGLRHHILPKATEERRAKRRARLEVVLIPLSVCLLFVIIFLAANPVLSRGAENLASRLFGLFGDAGGNFSILRVLFWALWLVVFSILLVPVVRTTLIDRLTKAPENLCASQVTAESDADERADRGYAAALWTLLSVNVLFFAYNLMDGLYLYGKAVLPAGMTWTEYTHQGCAWLTAGLALSTIVIGVIFRGPLVFHPKASRLRSLAYVWAGLNGVLAVGALRRLQLYIDFSGLTYLRLVGIMGTLLVVAGLLIMVNKVRLRKTFLWLLRGYLVAIWSATLILALLPADYLCARYNVPRVLAGKRHVLRPITHHQQSPEALPALLPLLSYQSKSPESQRVVRQGVAALLADHLVALRRRPRNWSEWQASAAWAQSALEAVEKQIKALEPKGRAEPRPWTPRQRLYQFSDQ